MFFRFRVPSGISGSAARVSCVSGLLHAKIHQDVGALIRLELVVRKLVFHPNKVEALLKRLEGKGKHIGVRSVDPWK